MERRTKCKPNKADITLIAVLIAVTVAGFAALWLTLDGGDVAVVYVDGEVWGRYRLDEDKTVEIETEYGHNVLIIKDGKADVTEADCPDRTCVSSRAVDKIGQTIICLPHKLTVKIEGGNKANADIELQ